MCQNQFCRYIELQEDSRGNQVICHYGYDLSGNRVLILRTADAFFKGCLEWSNKINNTIFNKDTYLTYEYLEE